MLRILLIRKIGSKQNFAPLSFFFATKELSKGLSIIKLPDSPITNPPDYFRNRDLLQSQSKMAGRIVFLRTYCKLWTAAVAACLATLVLAALILPHSFRLTALSDVIQCLLLFSGTVSLVPHAVQSRGRLRLFWTLIATGIALWFFYQLFWTYHEVWLRTDVPDLCAADIILFLHIVPLMAALALRPHAPQDEYAARLRRLDFALMMVWWAYLYVLIVIPWQYIVANVTLTILILCISSRNWRFWAPCSWPGWAAKTAGKLSMPVFSAPA
jgi:hypothetical protein